MKTTNYLLSTLSIAACVACSSSSEPSAPRVQTQAGLVEGFEQDGIDIYLGVPFAAPPVGDLRWKEPQPVQKYDTILQAKQFSADPMQPNIFGDMNFRGNGRSEDCLYLNIWSPKPQADETYPVLIYFNGGGWMAGSGSEPRYAGDSLAHHGIISITANYREGVFGFLTHPDLTKESPNHTSGNYGILDQAAAIQWVHQNIAAFGGDPNRIFIVGESAGSFSVSVLMASPLCKGLLAGALGSSGAEFAFHGAKPLAEIETQSTAMLESKGLNDITMLRSLPADSLQKLLPPYGMASIAIDGYLIDKTLDEIYEAGEQAHIPLLAGWNANEGTPLQYLMGQEPTLKNLRQGLISRFGNRTDEVLNVYGITTDADVLSRAAVDLASDLFTGFVTWRWCDRQQRVAPVYRYKYNHARPQMVAAMEGKEAALAGGVKDKDPNAKPQPTVPDGAVHSADIEYAMGNLDTNHVFEWTTEDKAIEQTFMNIYINFIKTANPNGGSLPQWDTIQPKNAPVMQIDVLTTPIADSKIEARYQLLDEIYKK